MAKRRGTKIALITDYNEEKDEFERKEYKIPFIKGRMLEKALELQEEIEAGLTEKAIFYRLIDFVVDDVFNGAFTKDDLLDGLIIDEIMDVLQGIFYDALGVDKKQVASEKIKKGK
ncbi:hypothetical protein A2G24_00985 [Listeria monocytogenes]|uniref:Phage protein n=1 Tax=Listeria monocytogenes TaxID=1639 RepID=A0A823DH80_LISMN|nr:hypothetical protein [Listeria monocytogenes]EAD1012200.1 hypothetical protein [Listeria monocytogenes]EAD1186107.1 hypothetical protein [Listeria monocytogenes]EAF8898026.1 hypothetical protein [Listeria monocytogenes]